MNEDTNEVGGVAWVNMVETSLIERGDASHLALERTTYRYTFSGEAGEEAFLYISFFFLTCLFIYAFIF